MDKADDEKDFKVSETVKKLFAMGISAAFMTEESIRSFLADANLPKDAVNLLVKGANKTKLDLINKVSKETMNIISKIDFVREFSRFAEEHKFKIQMEVDIIKKDQTKES